MTQSTMTVAILIPCLLSWAAGAGQSKEDDLDVNYDENMVTKYKLPPLLVTVEGKPVTTPEEWRNIRRPQILALFSNLRRMLVAAKERGDKIL